MNIPLAHTIAEVCKLANTGRTSVYSEIKSGALRAVKRGRRTLVLAEDLRSWIAGLPEITHCEGGKGDGSLDSEGRS